MYGANIGDVVHVLLDPAQNNGSDIAPALVVRTWGEPFEKDDVERQTINVRTLGDSAETLWLTSIALFEERPTEQELAERNPYNPKGYRAVAYQPSHPLAGVVVNADADA
jgi:hypothetical protein